MTSLFSIRGWHRIAFAALGLVVMVVLRFEKLKAYEISSWAEISAWILFLIGFCWSTDLEARFAAMVNRLFRRQVVLLPGENADSTIRSMERFAAAGARVGMIAIPVIHIGAYAWHYRNETIFGYDFFVKIGLELIATSLAGGVGGRILAYGLFGQWLNRKQVAIQVKLGHPDGAGGLEMIGGFYLYQAALVVLPAAFFAFWWAITPAWPVDLKEMTLAPEFKSWSSSFALFFILLLGLEVFAFLTPMSFFHREMLRYRGDCGQEGDKIGEKLLRLEEEMGTVSDRDELDSLSLRRQLLQSRFELLSSTPVWPIDRRVRRIFTWGNVSVIAVPVVTNLPFVSPMIKGTLKSLLGLA